MGKATIYRRWPSKLPLVVEAFGQLPGFEEIDSGSVAEDLERMLRGYIETFNSSPLASVLPSLAGERAHNPELAKLFDPVTRRRSQPLRRALERGVERGELRADLDLELASDLVVGPIAVALFYRGDSDSNSDLGVVFFGLLYSTSGLNMLVFSGIEIFHHTHESAEGLVHSTR